MPTRRANILLALALNLSFAATVVAEPPARNAKADPRKQHEPSQADIERLIERLGSASFADREEAMRELRRLGKPALEKLRKAAAVSKDLEVRKRVVELVDQLLEPEYSKKYKEGVYQLEQKKDYRKAAALFKQAVEIYERDPEIPRPVFPAQIDQPLLAEMYLRLARAYRGLQAHEKASNAYQRATYYYNYNHGKREEIDREWLAMINVLLRDYEKTVKAKIEKDKVLTALAGKYPLVILHTRRLAGGGYFKSAYSFVDETCDEEKHRNGVQILFDNGGEKGYFDINMVTNQHNLIVDLGEVDFSKDPDPKKVDPDSDTFWVPDRCKAIEDHVYLERIRDTDGNKFYVVMKMIAADEDSRYIAFIWRRLPGGKVVKHR